MCGRYLSKVSIPLSSSDLIVLELQGQRQCWIYSSLSFIWCIVEKNRWLLAWKLGLYHDLCGVEICPYASNWCLSWHLGFVYSDNFAFLNYRYPTCMISESSLGILPSVPAVDFWGWFQNDPLRVNSYYSPESFQVLMKRKVMKLNKSDKFKLCLFGNGIELHSRMWMWCSEWKWPC